MRTVCGFLALVWAGSALAAPAADCNQPVSFSLGSLHYTSQAAFPEPAVPVTLNFLFRYAPVPAATVCSVVFKSDLQAGTITATANTFAALARIYSARGKSDGILHLNTFFVARGELAEASPVRYNLATRQLQFRAVANSRARYTLGVKIDGGPVLPLYYNGRTTPLTVPASAKVVDIYAKVGEGVVSSWARVTINLAQPLIKTYSQAPFPTR